MPGMENLSTWSFKSQNIHHRGKLFLFFFSTIEKLFFFQISVVLGMFSNIYQIESVKFCIF